METALVFKVGILTTLSFIIAILATPLLTHFLYKYKLGKQIRDAASAPIFNALHAHKAGTPTMGGILIWGTTLVVALLTVVIGMFFTPTWADKISFITQRETLLPLGIFILAAIVGLIDDFMGIKRIGPKGGGMGVLFHVGAYGIVALLAALWFYFKLDWDAFHVPFIGTFNLGWWYIPVFVGIVMSSTHAVDLTDGLDGLAGGILAAGFSAMGAFAFAQGRFDLAAFCGVIVGALLAFLWFNISPARFFMGDTGARSMGLLIGVLAMFTNTALLLPLILFIPVIETLSVIIQLTSKKLRNGKKIFLSSPIHHHFQALGWPETKIVMRFWVIATVGTIIGVIIFLMDRGWY